VQGPQQPDRRRSRAERIDFGVDRVRPVTEQDAASHREHPFAPGGDGPPDGSGRAVEPGAGGVEPGIPGYDPGRFAMIVWLLDCTSPLASR